VPEIEVVLQGYHIGSDQGRFGLAGVYLIRGSRTVLVDTAHIGRRELLLKRLDQLGVAPSTIDVVLITHAHWDHMLNIDLFPEAQILLHQAELDYLRNPDPRDWATPPWMQRVLEGTRGGAATDDLELADGVRVLATPGHTWGSVSVAVDGLASKAAIVGDALPNARSAVQRAPYNVFADPDDAQRSAAMLVDNFTDFYPGHDRPFRIVDGKVTYLAESQLNVHGSLDPGDSDISVRISAMTPPDTYRLLTESDPMEDR
jgi:N-acyl homoserine lactone hydrolase